MAVIPASFDASCPVCGVTITIPITASGPHIDGDGPIRLSAITMHITPDTRPMAAHVRRWHGPRAEFPLAA